MADLPETSTWAGIYRLEVTDSVQGGPGGVSNEQARLLGNRTKWLRDNSVISQPGLSSYAGGDLLYANGGNSLAKLPIGAANRVLVSSGSVPQWLESLSASAMPKTPFRWEAGGATFGSGGNSLFGLVAREDSWATLNSAWQGFNGGSGLSAGVGWLMILSPAGHVGIVEISIGMRFGNDWPTAVRGLGNAAVALGPAGSGNYSDTPYHVTIGGAGEVFRISFSGSNSITSVSWLSPTSGATRVSWLYWRI